MEKIISLGFAAAIALGSVMQAEAAPVPILAAPSVSSSVIDVAACGPGTHLGRYGHYCWSNHPIASLCPPGYHLGPHGEYCWPVGLSVPANYTDPCPPNYHLGREGLRCWPG